MWSDPGIEVDLGHFLCFDLRIKFFGLDNRTCHQLREKNS